MAGGGRVTIKGGVASRQEALVIDGALVVTAVDGSVAGGSFQWNFFGEDAGSGVTSVDLNGNNDGIPLAKAVQTGRVSVRFQHDGTAPPSIGDWTLRLLKNGALAATFAVNTS